MGRSGRRLRNTKPKLKKEKPFFPAKSSSTETGAFFQAKGLTVGKPGDKYEKEANSVADSVVNADQSGQVIQEKEISSVQRESLSTPLEDEKLGTAEQRMEEDKLVQEQPEEEEEMRMMADEEEEEGLQKQDEEEEQMVQAKSENSSQCAPKSVSNTIKYESSKGKPLSGKVKKEMEKAFGVDFSEVKIHTGEKAQKMSKKLKARAFTCGKDIFFNEDKYKPEQAAGKKLLAHELTHVVQQKKSKNKK